MTKSNIRGKKKKKRESGDILAIPSPESDK